MTPEQYARFRERQARLDAAPCPHCGGDRLRANFSLFGACHAPLRKVRP